MEYVNGNMSKSSSTRRANNQMLKFCRCDDGNRQSYSNEDNISYETIEADDEIALSSKLYVTGGKFKLGSLSATAFDQNHEHEVIKDVGNEKGANDCMEVKDVVTSQSKSSLPSSQVIGSLNPLKWLNESDASKRMDKSYDSEWLELILSTMWRPWVHLSKYPGKCFPGESFPTVLCC